MHGSMVPLMTLVQLKHFITLARMGSFAKASMALFMTQPLTQPQHQIPGG